MQAKICDMQEPLKNELTQGVEALIREVEEFDTEYDTNGPMAPGLLAKEASERYIIEISSRTFY